MQPHPFLFLFLIRIHLLIPFDNFDLTIGRGGKIMAMSAVSTTAIIGNIVTKLALFLQNNLTNPHTTGNWVFTNYPELNVDYPIVTIAHSGFRDEYGSIGSEAKIVYATVRIEVWSMSTKERDEIWDDIYDELRTHYMTADTSGDSVTGINLFDMLVMSCLDIDIPRERGHLHKKVSEIQFSFYATS